MSRDFSINIFLYRWSRFHFGAHIGMKVSLSIWSDVKIRAPIAKRSRRDWTARKSIVKRRRGRPKKRKGVEEAEERDGDIEATYSMSIGLRDSTCRSYVETIASGTDNLLVCRIASYIVFVLLMRPDLAAFVRQATAAHKYLRHPSDRTSSFRDRGRKYTVRISS